MYLCCMNIMRFFGMKKFYLTLVLATLGLLTSCQEKEIDLRIIHTTDVHGNLIPYDYIKEKSGSGSMARLMSFMKEVRAKDAHVLLLDGGDMLQGEPITYYSNYIDSTRTNAVTEAMNFLAYDAATIGNHDIESGSQVYRRFVDEAKFPVLGANVLRVNDKMGKPYFEPYKVFDKGGAKVLVLGLTTPAIPQWLPQHLWAGMHFEDIIESAQKWVPRLIESEKPDLFVALIHSGLENDNPDYLENAGVELAKRVKGIDLILMGHDHRQTNQWIKRDEGDSVLLLNPANHLDYASDVSIKIFKKGNQVRKEIKASFADINAYEADTAFMKALAPYNDGVKAFLSKRVGILQPGVRAGEALVGASPYLNVLHQMQMATVSADISFAAPLNIRAEIPSGDIYVRDLFLWCPFSNHLYAMELTGQEIKGYLEHSYGGWAAQMKSSNEHLIALRPDAKPEDKYKTLVPTFNFSSAYGIDYTVDVTKPVGERVQITQMSNGEPFLLDKRYRVAINSYRAGGAGGMLTLGAGIKKEDLKSRIVEASQYDQFFSLMKYFETKGLIIPELDRNWQFVPQAWTQPAAKRDLDFIMRSK